MNNINVKGNLDDCKNELINIHDIIESMGSTARFVPYLTKYSVIKACGTIERAYKDIISDHCVSLSNSQQVGNYIEKTFRESSSNPSMDNIYKALKIFDSNWHQLFKNNINQHTNSSQLISSLKSLVDSRNSLAHGGNPTASVDNVIQYYEDSYIIMQILDAVVH